MSGYAVWVIDCDGCARRIDSEHLYGPMTLGGLRREACPQGWRYEKKGRSGFMDLCPGCQEKS